MDAVRGREFGEHLPLDDVARRQLEAVLDHPDCVGHPERFARHAEALVWREPSEQRVDDQAAVPGPDSPKELCRFKGSHHAYDLARSRTFGGALSWRAAPVL